MKSDFIIYFISLDQNQFLEWVALKRAVSLADYDLSLTTDAACQLDVLWHDGDALGVDGAEVGVLEDANQVGLRGFLKGHDGRGLESEISLEVLGDLTDKSLEGQLADQKLGGFLVAADLTKGDGARSESVWLLDTTGGWGTLAGGLGGQLLAWGFTTG